MDARPARPWPVPPAGQDLLQEAARVRHKNLSEFLLEAGIEAANIVLANRQGSQTSKAFGQA